MQLYELILSKTEGLSRGKFLGRVRLRKGGTVVDASDPKLKKRLEELFSKPIRILVSDPTSDPGMLPSVKEVLPHTPEFFKHAYYELRSLWKIFPVPEKEDQSAANSEGREDLRRLERAAVLNRFLRTLR